MSLNKLSLYTQDTKHKVCVYGGPGTGKTTAIAKLATLGWKLKYMDAENSLEVLAANIPAQYQSNVDCIKIPDTLHVPAFAPIVHNLFHKGMCNLCQKHLKSNCIAAECKDISARFEVQLSPQPRDEILVIESSSQLFVSTISGIQLSKRPDEPESHQITQPEWGQISGKLNAIYSYVQARDINCIFTSHVISDVNEEGKARLTPTLGSGPFSLSASKYFSDVVLVTDMGANIQWHSKFMAKPGAVTKSRTSADTNDPKYKGNPLQAIFGMPPQTK